MLSNEETSRIALDLVADRAFFSTVHVSTKIPRETDTAPAAALHPLETALLGITALHLGFLPWALGTMHLWSQLCSLMLSAIGLALALIPRTNTLEELSIIARAPSRLKALLRSPIFWFGFANLVYIALQGLNPAWQYMKNDTTWWMAPVDHAEWLPAGMEVPFQQAGPWRALIIFSSLWFLVWSVWIGLRRRRSLRVLLVILAVNALLLSLFGILEQLTGATRIFWTYRPSNGNFVSSFIYRNHAGAYFNLALAATVGLFFWFQKRAERQHQKSSPALFLALIGVIDALLVLISRSRGAIAGLAVFTGVLTVLLAWKYFREKREPCRGLGRLFLVLLFAVFIGICAVALRMDQTWKRLSDFAANPNASWEFRTTAREAATAMFLDRPVLGWGAGCFRYGFPLYAQKYPTLGYNGPRPLFWEHAHDDLLEFPIELGVLGLLPLLAAIGLAATELARCRFWDSTLPLLLVLACLITLGHAWVDFVFQNPAVLFTWALLLLIAVRWAQDHRQILINVAAVAASRKAEKQSCGGTLGSKFGE